MWTVFLRAPRAAHARAQSVGAALGAVIVLGALLALAGVLGFVEIAHHVRAGRTQAFDETVLRWIGAHHTAWLDSLMLEATTLGTWIVVLTVGGVAALFLYLTRHRARALLLLVATSGGIALDSLLKLGFRRPRPDVFPWQIHVATWSFPSGHAVNATIVYLTLAYLAARMQQTRVARALTVLAAVLLIGLICASRLYLGVHYPSDVAGGISIGVAWAAFCVATLEGVRRGAPASWHSQR